MSTTNKLPETIPSRLHETIEEQRDRLFQAQAMVMLSNDRLRGFSGDEDSLEIVSELSTISFAMDGATKLMDGISEALEIVGRGDEQPPETDEPVAGPASSAELAGEAKAAINRQRARIFEAMAVVDVTSKSFEEADGDNTSPEYALRLAYRVLDGVAGKLDEISMYGTDGDDDEGGAQS